MLVFALVIKERLFKYPESSKIDCPENDTLVVVLKKLNGGIYGALNLNYYVFLTSVTLFAIFTGIILVYLQNQSLYTSFDWVVIYCYIILFFVLPTCTVSGLFMIFRLRNIRKILASFKRDYNKK